MAADVEVLQYMRFLVEKKLVAQTLKYFMMVC